MFEELLTNKYFCIAILIILIVVLYLYSQKNSCGKEGLQNLEMGPADFGDDTRWVSRRKKRRPRTVSHKFDSLYDKEFVPKPFDGRPDLGQCQPCICDSDSDSDTESSFDLDSTITEPPMRRKN